VDVSVTHSSSFNEMICISPTRLRKKTIVFELAMLMYHNLLVTGSRTSSDDYIIAVADLQGMPGGPWHTL
jgi:hypothetical protein